MNALIPTRVSGPSSIEVSALAFGSWDTWNRVSFDEVVENLRIATEAGVTLFDVGLYGAGERQSSTDLVLARALNQLGLPREGYQLAAKGWLPQTFLGVEGIAPLGEQLELILSRHGTDFADFLVLGDLMIDVPDFTPILEQVKGTIDAGKARGWSVNNWSAAEIARATAQAAAIGLQPPEYAQLKYGLTRRSVPEGEPFASLCSAQGLTIQASDAFEGGLIFGRGEGPTRMIGGDIGGTQHRIKASLERFKAAAASLGATVAQLAIAVPMLNPYTSSVLVGSRTVDQTRDNIGAFALLARHGAEEIQAVADEFWFDRGIVSPDSSWGTKPGDDPAAYAAGQK